MGKMMFGSLEGLRLGLPRFARNDSKKLREALKRSIHYSRLTPHDSRMTNGCPKDQKALSGLYISSRSQQKFTAFSDSKSTDYCGILPKLRMILNLLQPLNLQLCNPFFLFYP